MHKPNKLYSKRNFFSAGLIKILISITRSTVKNHTVKQKNKSGCITAN